MLNMGIGEWAVILIIVLIFFGPKRLPGLAQSIGKSFRELKNGLSGVTEDIKESMQAEPKPTVTGKPEPEVHPTSQSEAQPVTAGKPEIKNEPNRPAL